MNEIGKLSCAGALVALGLGSAFLCGPPADAPQVVRESSSSGQRLQLGPLSRSGTVARSEDEKLARRIGSSKDSPSGVVLSAASVSPLPGDREEPSWFPTSPARGDRAPRPPRLVAIDEDAMPLLANSPPASAADSWLLKPPKISHTYGGQSSRDTKPIFVSESAAEPVESETTAWWTRDTPRLQGLAGSVPTTPTGQPPPSKETAQPAEPSRHTLSGPIDLDPPVAAAAPRRSMPAAPQPLQPMRTHVVADGDTLTRLAARYLGDANRAEEIFELNRDVLRHPELLPIGAALRIPGKSDEPEVEDFSTAGRMVPIGAPPVADTQPRAQLQGPAPIAANGW